METCPVAAFIPAARQVHWASEPDGQAPSTGGKVAPGAESKRQQQQLAAASRTADDAAAHNLPSGIVPSKVEGLEQLGQSYHTRRRPSTYGGEGNGRWL